jgi:hypothetical protein
VSLRTQIHSAFDEVAPATHGLPERVVQTVLTENASSKRRERMMLRLRVPLSLVAVFMLVALVVGVLIGGRLMQDWNAFHNSAPAGGVSRSALADLEARPLTLPTLKAGDTCPTSARSSQPNPGENLFDYGTGPVYANGGPEIQTSWGYYFDVTWVTDANLAGPVLVRGRDLMSDRILVFVGAYSAGAVVGTDTQAGSQLVQRAELVLDPKHPHSRVTGGYGYFPVRQGLASGWVGCFGVQIDGPTFTETVTAFAAP